MDQIDTQDTPKESSRSHKTRKESGTGEVKSASKSKYEHARNPVEKHAEHIPHQLHSGQDHQPVSSQPDVDDGVDWSVWLVLLAAILVIFNQVQIVSINSALGGGPITMGAGVGALIGSGVGGGKFFEMDGSHIYGPTLLSTGEGPAITGYKTKFKLWPTISSQAIPEKSSGDQTQDAVNAMVPRGVPSYGQAAGLSFDDPIVSQKKLGSYDRLQLTPVEQKRWEGIVNKFTCDYCCGSPQNPTIITRCGCAHAAGWRGLAKWFVKNMPEVSDDQIFGELTKWKTLWYPGPSIKRLLQELGSGSGGGAASSAALPEMVGGC